MSTPQQIASGAPVQKPVDNTAQTPNTRPGFMAQLWANRKARIGIVLLVFFLLMATVGPLLAPYSLNDTNFAVGQPPSWAHWLGTTQRGQDVFTQLLYGSRVSLFVGFVTGVITILIAMLVGFLSAYYRGWLDDGLSLIINVVLVIPGLPLMILLATYIPSHGMWEIIGVMSATGWAFGGRSFRAQMMTVAQQDYVVAARFAGERAWRIVFKEIAPNMLSYIVAHFFGAVVGAVLGEAGLEFLGLGNPSITSWGTMIYWAQNGEAMLTGQWAWILAPGLCIALVATSLTLINFGVDAIANPRLQED